MEASTASESAITTAQAVEYLREKHNLEYNAEYLDQLARQGDAPSHKVGRHRRYRRSLLDAWALGEWVSDAEAKARAEAAQAELDRRLAEGS